MAKSAPYTRCFGQRFSSHPHLRWDLIIFYELWFTSFNWVQINLSTSFLIQPRYSGARKSPLSRGQGMQSLVTRAIAHWWITLKADSQDPKKAPLCQGTVGARDSLRARSGDCSPGGRTCQPEPLPPTQREAGQMGGSPGDWHGVRWGKFCGGAGRAVRGDSSLWDLTLWYHQRTLSTLQLLRFFVFMNISQEHRNYERPIALPKAAPVKRHGVQLRGCPRLSDGWCWFLEFYLPCFLAAFAPELHLPWLARAMLSRLLKEKPLAQIWLGHFLPLVVPVRMDIWFVSFLPSARSPEGTQLLEKDIGGHLSCSPQVYQKHSAGARNTIIRLDLSPICSVQDMCREKKGIVNTAGVALQRTKSLLTEDTYATMPPADLTALQQPLLCRKHGRRLFSGVVQVLLFPPTPRPTREMSVSIDTPVSIPSLFNHSPTTTFPLLCYTQEQP